MESTAKRRLRRVKRSAQQWQAVMAQYARSGLSQEAFCVREGLAPSTFASWRARLRRENGQRDAGAAFLEMLAPAAMASPASFDIELDLGRGVVLRMRSR